jgi:dTDP-4-amino-4,6-dideoxygalactose transaminase
MTAEGVGCGFTYIGVPIFLCMEACCSKVTFGTSQYPFVGPQASREYEYTEGMCPKAEELLQHLITIPLNENMSRKNILSIASVIRKVARLLAR